jgi:hypothetical protein
MANQYHDAFVMAHRAEGSPYDVGTILSINPKMTLAPLTKGGKQWGDWHVFHRVNSAFRFLPEPDCRVLMYMGFCNLRESTEDGRQKSHLWLWGDRLVSINPNIVAAHTTVVQRKHVSQKASRSTSLS